MFKSSSNKVQVIEDWPPISSGAPMPLVWSDEATLVVRYITTNDEFAIIKFPLVSDYKFGGPNDEALSGHPLYKNGLQFYSAHRVVNSSWIEELEQRNSVHPQHDRARFLEGKVHYILTFHDSTLELVSMEIRGMHPEISVFSGKDDSALQHWRSLLHV